MKQYMDIREHTLDNVKLIELPISILSRAITNIYTTHPSLYKQFERKILEGEYVTPMIYFVKRQLISFDLELLKEVLEDLKQDLRYPLYLSFKSFLDKNDSHAFSMYLIKNRHVEYVKKIRQEFQN